MPQVLVQNCVLSNNHFLGEKKRQVLCLPQDRRQWAGRVSICRMRLCVTAGRDTLILSRTRGLSGNGMSQGYKGWQLCPPHFLILWLSSQEAHFYSLPPNFHRGTIPSRIFESTENKSKGLETYHFFHPYKWKTEIWPYMRCENVFLSDIN